MPPTKLEPMKYLYSILIIAIVSTLITFYMLRPEKQPVNDDIALTINDHHLTKKLLQEQAQSSGYQQDNTEEFLDSFITRELLIQEAQNQAIDKEPSFRKALKTFYEHSLIKVLMDRKVQSIDVQVTDNDVDLYLSSYGKNITFSRFPVTETYPKTILYDQGKQTTALFDDLAEPLKVTLSSMKVGDIKEQFRTSNTRQAIRLDKVGPSGPTTVTPVTRKIAAQMILDLKKEEEISNWINELRSKASIQIHHEKKQP